MLPGKKPRIVRQILMQRSAPQPATRATPTGGTENLCQHVVLTFMKWNESAWLTEDGDDD